MNFNWTVTRGLSTGNVRLITCHVGCVDFAQCAHCDPCLFDSVCSVA